MSEPTPNDPRKITLEDLLRLKRHERPEADFWVRFDRELNEKVWRSLVQTPVASQVSRRSWLARAMGWVTAGSVAVLTVTIGWLEHSATAPVVASVTSPHQSYAFLSSSTPVSSASVPSIEAASSDTAASEGFSTSAKSTYAVDDLTPTVSPAGHNKIPAAMSFAIERKDGEQYATDAINSALFSTHWRGSAY